MTDDANARCAAHVLYTCPHCKREVTVHAALQQPEVVVLIDERRAMYSTEHCVCPHCHTTIPSWRGDPAT